MSAPTLYIAVPAAVALVLLVVRHWEGWVAAAGVLAAGCLAWFAWRMPIDVPVSVGPWSIEVTEALTFFGRRFLLENADRPILVLLYSITAIWLACAPLARPGQHFVPLGLAIVSFFTAALAVEPFLYAALFIEIAALISVALFVSPGRTVGAGVLRFLTFQTLGVPFILFTGWLLTGVEASPGELTLIVHAAVLLGLGFTLLLAVFPFHTWIPMLTEEVHPYPAGFLLVMLPAAVFLFGLGFLDRFAWLRVSTDLYPLLRYAGLLMSLVGGLSAVFQRHLARMLGYAVIAEIGLSLLALSLPGAQGLSLFFYLFPARVLAIVVWSLALTALRAQALRLDFASARGVIWRYPVVGLSLVIGHLALAGLPGLAAFPARLALWRAMAPQFPGLALLSVVGSIGLLVGGLRTADRVIQAPETEGPIMLFGDWTVLRLVLLAGLLGIALLGLFPNWVQSAMTGLASAYGNIY